MKLLIEYIGGPLNKTSEEIETYGYTIVATRLYLKHLEKCSNDPDAAVVYAFPKAISEGKTTAKYVGHTVPERLRKGR